MLMGGAETAVLKDGYGFSSLFHWWSSPVLLLQHLVLWCEAIVVSIAGTELARSLFWCVTSGINLGVSISNEMGM